MLRAGSWHSQWVQTSISIPGRTAYIPGRTACLRSPKRWFSAAVYSGPERAPARWVWAVVGWLLSAVWPLWIPSLTWNSPHPGLAHGRAHSVHPAGRSCSLTRWSSALCPVSRQMFRCCLLPSLQAPPLLVLPDDTLKTFCLQVGTLLVGAMWMRSRWQLQFWLMILAIPGQSPFQDLSSSQ